MAGPGQANPWRPRGASDRPGHPVTDSQALPGPQDARHHDDGGDDAICVERAITPDRLVGQRHDTPRMASSSGDSVGAGLLLQDRKEDDPGRPSPGRREPVWQQRLASGTRYPAMPETKARKGRSRWVAMGTRAASSAGWRSNPGPVPCAKLSVTVWPSGGVPAPGVKPMAPRRAGHGGLKTQPLHGPPASSTLLSRPYAPSLVAVRPDWLIEEYNAHQPFGPVFLSVLTGRTSLLIKVNNIVLVIK